MSGRFMQKPSKKRINYILVIAVSLSIILLTACSINVDSSTVIDFAVNRMSMDDKISQMIIPAFRTWDDENVTNLNDFPALKKALKKHQYGGIILFSSNISDTEQVTRLLCDLQENNENIESTSFHIPYLTAVDEEGGLVICLSSGTRMNGNMAIGATADAVDNARTTGTILGEELASVGFNVDFAPVIDVNCNPSNPIIGTRSFSDDPIIVSELGTAYSEGLAGSNVIATYKHFPGHGDTDVDSHTGTPSVEKTYEEILESELVPFKNAIETGAEMIMTAHITYPLIDDEVTFADGVTKGFYPATMSEKMISGVLRRDLGFDGVVITDALEMDAIRTAGLVPGEEGSAEYCINISEKVINAGVDLLLIPMDLKNEEAADFYDDYINGLKESVEKGEISEERINESVKRILLLKMKHGMIEMPWAQKKGTDIEKKVADSKKVVGSAAHHETEMTIAREAVTLLKNDRDLLPLSMNEDKIVLLGRKESDAVTLDFIIKKLINKGFIKDDADVSIEYYYDPDADVKLHYTDEMKDKISSADVVIGFSYISGNVVQFKEDPQYIGITSAIEDTHKAGGRFILISENLPYDAAIYQDADAIVLAYLGRGNDIDPAEAADNESGMGAINANIIAAVEMVFGNGSPKGHLPVNIPVVEKLPDKTPFYGSDILYERGFGLS